MTERACPELVEGGASSSQLNPLSPILISYLQYSSSPSMGEVWVRVMFAGATKLLHLERGLGGEV